MEFFIRKNATLPLLKMQVVKDGRGGYLELMNDLETATIYFTMINVSTGIPKIVSDMPHIVLTKRGASRTHTLITRESRGEGPISRETLR